MDTKINNSRSRLSCTIFGSTGLIGSHLKDYLAKDPAFIKVNLPGRRKQPIDKNTQLESQEIDFDQLEQYADLFKVDVVFICLGTTMKQAGSKEAFQRVDKQLVHEIAGLARQHDCQKVMMISSLGADSSSNNFYLKTKGEAEELVRRDGPKHLHILRPSLLLGKRSEFRLGEQLAQWFMPLFSFLMIGKFKKYRPIKAKVVAKALQLLAKQDRSETVLLSDQIKALVAENK